MPKWDVNGLEWPKKYKEGIKIRSKTDSFYSFRPVKIKNFETPKVSKPRLLPTLINMRNNIL